MTIIDSEPASSRLDYTKAPFPYFGGKRHAAPLVWAALGDVDHYVEPFAGSLAILLQRPHLANRPYHSETVNDADGLLINVWRSIQFYPQETAEAASWPVTEADLMARQLGILKWHDEAMQEKLRADPEFCDPKIAGWWIWGISAWIGGGWCNGDGAWIVDLDTGRVRKRRKGERRQVDSQRPFIGSSGQGVNLPQAREPGVTAGRPILANGAGVNHANAREPGVRGKRPELTDGGKGVNHADAREPGVTGKMPYIVDNGRGPNTGNAREPGVTDDLDFHPMTMPEIRAWFGYLSARLRHVRILNGDWARLTTGAATKILGVRRPGGICGVFLDPPYTFGERADGLYRVEQDVAADVQAWCRKNGNDPKLRIVLAGFDTEHAILEAEGWRAVEWFTPGWLKGGMGNAGKDGHQMHRDRLWMSPNCLAPDEDPQQELF